MAVASPSWPFLTRKHFLEREPQSEPRSSQGPRVHESTNPGNSMANPSFSHHLSGPGLPSILGAQLKTVATHAAGTSLHVLACLAGIRDKKELRRRVTKLSGAVLGHYAIGSLVKIEKEEQEGKQPIPVLSVSREPSGFSIDCWRPLRQGLFHNWVNHHPLPKLLRTEYTVVHLGGWASDEP